MTKPADAYKVKNNTERVLLDIINKESPHYRYKSLVDANYYKQTPIMKFFGREDGYKLTKRQWDYLLKNSDLTQKNYAGESALCYAIVNAKHKILDDERWECLMEKTNLTEQDGVGWDALCYAMFADMFVGEDKIKKKIIEKILEKNINYFNGDYWDRIISKDNTIGAQIPGTKKLVEEIKERVKIKEVIDKAVNKKKKKSLIKI